MTEREALTKVGELLVTLRDCEPKCDCLTFASMMTVIGCALLRDTDRDRHTFALRLRDYANELDCGTFELPQGLAIVRVNKRPLDGAAA